MTIIGLQNTLVSYTPGMYTRRNTDQHLSGIDISTEIPRSELKYENKIRKSQKSLP